METDDLTWLDGCFVEKVLQKSEDDDSIKVLNITVNPATAAGDNFLSNLQRVIVKLSRHQKGQEILETRSVIVKIELQSGPMKELISFDLENSGMFETETSMLFETLPKLNEILAKLRAPPLAARCLYVQKEHPMHLIMEDLTLGGYEMVTDRQAGLNLDHCLLALRNLAIFHASSVALVEKDPKSVQIYKKPLFSKDYYPSGDEFFNGGIRMLAEEARSWSDLNPRITEKVLHLSTCIFEKVCEAIRFKEDDFNVLNHGDFWINNIMFRYDKHQNHIDLKFVDFQFSYYGSPALDILYFLGMIMSKDIRMIHRELLLREYHDSLTSTMAKLECKTEAPSFENLKEILKEHNFIEIISTLKVLPLILIDGGQETTANEMLGLNSKFDSNTDQGKLLQKVMTEVLIFYDSKGLLDL